MPAHAYALADGDPLGIRTDGSNLADDFVTKDGRVLGNAPVIVQDREIGVTQPAVFDGDFNVLRLKRSEVHILELNRLSGRADNPSLIRAGENRSRLFGLVIRLLV